MATIPFIGMQMLFYIFFLLLHLNFIKTNVKRNIFSLTSAGSKVVGWLVQLRSVHNVDQPPHSADASSDPGESEVVDHGEEIRRCGETDQQN